MSAERAQGGVGWIREADHNGFVALVQGIVHHSNIDVLGGDTRSKGKRPVGQRIIDTSAGGRAARYCVVNGHRFTRNCRERDRQGSRSDILQTAGTGDVERHRWRQVVVGDDCDDLLGP